MPVRHVRRRISDQPVNRRRRGRHGGTAQSDVRAPAGRHFSHVAVRQWVLSLPCRLRYRLAWDHDLCHDVAGVPSRSIFRVLRDRARDEGVEHGRSGAVIVIQRFGCPCSPGRALRRDRGSEQQADGRRPLLRYACDSLLLMPAGRHARAVAVSRRQVPRQVRRLVERCHASGRTAYRFFTASIGTSCIHPGPLVVDRPDSPHRHLDHVRAELYFGVGDHNPSTTPEQMAALEKALQGERISYQLEWHPGAQHGFMMPSRTAAYNPPAAEKVWGRIASLFARALR